MSTPQNHHDKTFDMGDAERAWGSAYVPERVQMYLLVAMYGLLLWQYPTTSQILGLSSDTFLPVLGRVALLVVGFVLLAFVSLTPSISVFWAYFGFPYQEHRLTYTRAGGHDLMRLLPVVVQGAGLGLYWWTSQMTPDPIPGIRGIGYLIGFTTLAELILSPLLSLLLFMNYARHHRPELLRRREQWRSRRR